MSDADHMPYRGLRSWMISVPLAQIGTLVDALLVYKVISIFVGCFMLSVNVPVTSERSCRAEAFVQKISVTWQFLALATVAQCISQYTTIRLFMCSPYMMHAAPCGLRGCKNGPAPFPGRMSYKATKPGLVSVLYLICFLLCWYLLGPLFMYC